MDDSSTVSKGLDERRASISRIQLVQEAAGARYERLELNAVVETDNRRQAAEELSVARPNSWVALHRSPRMLAPPKKAGVREVWRFRSLARGKAPRRPTDVRVLTAAEWRAPDGTAVSRGVVMHGIQLHPPS